MTQFTVTSGDEFGLWIVLSASHRDRWGTQFWLCECRCGVRRSVSQVSLRNGGSQSCGCLARAKASTHKQSKTPTYKVWARMVYRARDGNDVKNYSERGIGVDSRWLKFENFLADMGVRPPNPVKGQRYWSIGRIDNNKGYSPTNCRWETPAQQADNKRTSVFYYWEGQRITIRQLASRYKIPYRLLAERLNRQRWPLETALAIPYEPRVPTYPTGVERYGKHKWRARVRVDKRAFTVGIFPSMAEAHFRRQEAMVIKQNICNQPHIKKVEFE